MTHPSTEVSQTIPIEYLIVGVDWQGAVDGILGDCDGLAPIFAAFVERVIVWIISTPYWKKELNTPGGLTVAPMDYCFMYLGPFPIFAGGWLQDHWYHGMESGDRCANRIYDTLLLTVSIRIACLSFSFRRKEPNHIFWA